MLRIHEVNFCLYVSVCLVIYYVCTFCCKKTKPARDDGYEVANKMRQRDQLVRDKSRLQAELDSVTKQLGRDALRLRDLQYAAKASVLNVCPGHEWNYCITKKSFVNDVGKFKRMAFLFCCFLNFKMLFLLNRSNLSIAKSQLQSTWSSTALP